MSIVLLQCLHLESHAVILHRRLVRPQRRNCSCTADMSANGTHQFQIQPILLLNMHKSI